MYLREVNKVVSCNFPFQDRKFVQNGKFEDIDEGIFSNSQKHMLKQFLLVADFSSTSFRRNRVGQTLANIYRCL